MIFNRKGPCKCCKMIRGRSEIPERGLEWHGRWEGGGGGPNVQILVTMPYLLGFRGFNSRAMIYNKEGACKCSQMMRGMSRIEEGGIIWD